MKTHVTAVAIAMLACGLTTQAETTLQELQPYPLPAEVEQSFDSLARECDVLIVGETHGTQEVPAVVESLLAPLDKLGYRALALEIPHDDQAAIAAWATGATDAVPVFFAEPGPDGRGNEQVLALVRRALSPPYDWKLICFDQSQAEMERQMRERLPKDAEGTIAERAAKLSSADFVALWVDRDAAMAKYLAAGKRNLPQGDKILAICGNFHARTADHAPPESQFKAMWPSFAAVLAQDHPAWRLKSINVRAYGGEYFNGGKVNRFSERPLERVEMRSTPNADWDAELNLPKATVATFLKPPATVE